MKVNFKKRRIIILQALLAIVASMIPWLFKQNKKTNAQNAHTLTCKPNKHLIKKIATKEAKQKEIQNSTKENKQQEPIYFTGEKLKYINKLSHKLKKIRNAVGFGNFNVISFDEMVYIAKRYSGLERLSRKELLFLEELFYYSAQDYGFYGKKVSTNLTESINKKNIIKISHTGNFLYKGEALKAYKSITKSVNSITLTSGVRGIPKQMQLFISKAKSTKGNMSLASHSLAPPGYSYHAIGDFDIGKIGLGLNNFTEKFSQTDEFKKLIDLGFMDIRYYKDNPYGVRYEPWHIEIT